MQEESKTTVKCLIPMLAFISIAILDWFYIFTIQRRPDILINAWFVMFPTISFFYFAFTFISCYGMLSKTRWGFAFAYCVIFFGTISSTLSYSLIYRTEPKLVLIFGALIILNALVLGYLALFAGGIKKCED